MQTMLVYDLLIILTSGLLASIICRHLNASVLIGYLLIGAILGKGCLNWIHDEGHEIEHLAEVGVFMLLFTIGLEFSIDALTRLGRHLVVGGGVQMLLVGVPVGAILIGLGIDWRPAVLLASALSFSSTVLVFKSLSESGHATRSHGQRMIGILLFQDIALVPLLLAIPLLTGGDEPVRARDYVFLALTSLMFVGAISVLRWTLSEWIIPRFAKYQSPELILLFAIVCLAGITLAAYEIGLPPAIGAFAAGLIFNGNRWTKQIDALVLPFRETFAAVFFVSLGLLFVPRLLWEQPVVMFGMFALLIVVKAIAASIALRLTSIPWRQSIGLGIGLAHVGEFAFVLVLLGVEAGIIPELRYQQMVTLATATLFTTPFLMKWGLKIARFAEDHAHTDELQPHYTIGKSSDGLQEAIVIGAGPIGQQVTSQLEMLGYDVCLIDLSPVNLHSFAQAGFRNIAGNAAAPETLNRAGAETATLVVISVPNDDVALQVLKTLRKLNKACQVLVRCRYQANTKKLLKAGASFVVSEEQLASTAFLSAIEKHYG